MNPGMRDRLIEIKQKSATNRNGVQEVDYVSLYAAVPCWVRYLGGGESVNSDKKESVSRVTFQIAYLPDVDTTMMVVYDGSNYNIEEIVPIGRNRELQLQGRLND